MKRPGFVVIALMICSSRLLAQAPTTIGVNIAITAHGLTKAYGPSQAKKIAAAATGFILAELTTTFQFWDFRSGASSHSQILFHVYNVGHSERIDIALLPINMRDTCAPSWTITWRTAATVNAEGHFLGPPELVGRAIADGLRDLLRRDGADIRACLVASTPIVEESLWSDQRHVVIPLAYVPYYERLAESGLGLRVRCAPACPYGDIWLDSVVLRGPMSYPRKFLRNRFDAVVLEPRRRSCGQTAADNLAKPFRPDEARILRPGEVFLSPSLASREIGEALPAALLQ